MHAQSSWRSACWRRSGAESQASLPVRAFARRPWTADRGPISAPGPCRRKGMSDRSWHLVCYDIQDDGRLRRVAKLLEGYGERVQYSIFRCRLTSREAERLRWELTRVTTPDDAWLIVPLCSACARRLRRHDSRASWPP